MKRKIVFIILLIQIVLFKNSFTQSIRLKTNFKNGYYLELHQFKCRFIKNETKYYINTNDTIIKLEGNIKYANIVIWNNIKVFFSYIPLYIDSNLITLELSIRDTITNEVDKLKAFQVFGSQSSIDYSNFYRNQKLSELNNNNNIEEVKEYYKENPSNIFALYLLSKSNKYGDSISNCIDKDFSNCIGIKFLLESFRELDSICEYSKTYLDFNNFVTDLSKYSKALFTFYKISIDDFNKEGKIYFWASWCKPCLKEIMLLSAEEKGNKNNYFLSLDNDSKKCLNAAKKVGLTSNVYMTTQDWLKKYQIDLIPTIIYYNSQKHFLKKVM